uniref:ER membrane protein complex subunit 2 n=1 Tax=Kwoniella pini CBS 10737 TaxID=1296096 RepID=A0A1B9HTW1_9TREE|nr:uncharacterized protein I206_07563 [Kwoniella pini CBS 10737]OCF46708.1 hypothetical protein I206_07563 [Kwoniella pini CBS 10737]
MSNKSDIELLSNWRTIGSRNSEKVIELSEKVLKGKVFDQEWAIREQLAIAALDLGKNELANSAHQRLISLSLSTSTIQNTIIILLKYLDIFYSDPSGWSLLSELYSELNLYNQSLDSLGHLLLIQPWDENQIRRSGEIAYTLGDYQLSLKHFLRSLEMKGNVEENKNSNKTRTWWGIKLSVSRLLESNSSSNSSSNLETIIPFEMRTNEKQLKLLDELSTENLLSSTSSGKGLNLDITRRLLSNSIQIKEIIR